MDVLARRGAVPEVAHARHDEELLIEMRILFSQITGAQ